MNLIAKVGTKSLRQHMARWHASIPGHSGQALARSSLMKDNVPPYIQSRIDTSVESIGMTTMHAAASFGALTSWGRWAVDFDFKRQNSIVAALNEWPPTVYAACKTGQHYVTVILHNDIFEWWKHSLIQCIQITISISWLSDYLLKQSKEFQITSWNAVRQVSLQKYITFSFQAVEGCITNKNFKVHRNTSN